MTTKHRFFTIGFCSLATAGVGIAQNPPIADPAVWLRADQGIVTDVNGKVERWEDQSGNGNHFEQGTAAKRPELDPDGFVLGGAQLNRIERHLGGVTPTLG